MTPWLLLLLIPVLPYLPALFGFAYQPGSPYSDLTVTHYPNAVFLRQALQQWHVVPFWSPSILSGYPFAADPLSSLWYPPAWLNVILPMPFGFNLLIILHVLWGGVGFFHLLQARALSPRAALLGALLFASLPKLFSHYVAGHITLVYAVCWTPWLLWASEKQWDSPSPASAGWLQGVILGVIALADIRWAAYAGIFWVIYTLVHRRNPSQPAEKRWAGWGRLLGRVAVQIILSLLISAPVWLPLLQYVQYSTRAALTSVEAFQLSLPAGSILSLLFPNFGGYAEWVVYAGGLSTVFLVLYLAIPYLRKRGAFWLLVFIVTLVYAIGSAIPFLPLVAHLPGLDLLRVPSRVMFLNGMALAVLVADGIDLLLKSDGAQRLSARPNPNLWLVALIGFAAVMSIGMPLILKKIGWNFIWGTLALVVFTVLLNFRRKGNMPVNIWWRLVVGFCLIDLVGVDFLSIQVRTPAQVYAEGGEAAQFLAGQPGTFRVYSPSYSIPQQTAANYRLELADGVDPMQLLNYTLFMEKATGVPRKGYSVTMPPLENGEPSSDNRSYIPDTHLLGLLNVEFLVSEFPLQAKGLILEKMAGKSYVYRNQNVHPRAWLQSQGDELGKDARPVVLTRKASDRIEVEVDGEGLLVLSEVYYPGWKVWVDGAPEPIEEVGGVLRGVSLSTGKHQIVFTFQPLPVYLGAGLAGLTWLGVILFTLIRKARR